MNTCLDCDQKLTHKNSIRCHRHEVERRRAASLPGKYVHRGEHTDMTDCQVHGHTKVGRPPTNGYRCSCITEAMLVEEEIRRTKEWVRFWCNLCGEDTEEQMTAVELGRTTQKYCQRCGSRMFAETVGPRRGKVFLD